MLGICLFSKRWCFFYLGKDPKQRSLYLFDGSQASEVFDKGIDAKTLYHGSCFKELFSKIGAWGLGVGAKNVGAWGLGLLVIVIVIVLG